MLTGLIKIMINVLDNYNNYNENGENEYTQLNLC